MGGLPAALSGVVIGRCGVLERAGFRVVGTEISYAAARRIKIEETILRLDLAR